MIYIACTRSMHSRHRSSRARISRDSAQTARMPRRSACARCPRNDWPKPTGITVVYLRCGGDVAVVPRHSAGASNRRHDGSLFDGPDRRWPNSPSPSWLARGGPLRSSDPGFWMLAAVPIALALFGLRVTRGQSAETASALRRRGCRALVGVPGGAAASARSMACTARPRARRRSRSSWRSFPCSSPAPPASRSELWRRLALRVALPLTVASAMIATATGMTAAFSIIDMVNAAG